ncbi:unnamed protein product [Mycena citricolor]|uniref:Uncharacterized protein n=1 Tax=Mycena citricolor TaxID=2018698 RepID=A0AAD2HYM1_9AGAR|nr:unnamed protein product [Mycena citricolor]
MQSFRRTFNVENNALRSNHPYALRPGQTTQTLLFFEFRSYGPPTSDFGRPGDVYIDLSPTRHALYWRERNVDQGMGAGDWCCWSGITCDPQMQARHPWVRSSGDVYLSVDLDGVHWASIEEISASRMRMGLPLAPRGGLDPRSMTAEVLGRMLTQEQQRRSTVSPTLTSPHVLSPLLHHRAGTPAPLSAVANSGGPLVSAHDKKRRRASMGVPPSSMNSSASSTASFGGPLVHSPSSSSTALLSQPHPFYGLPRGMPEAPPVLSPDNPIIYADLPQSERVRAAHLALDRMRFAQDAEMNAKHALKEKNGELAQARQREKDIISISYHYQKRERELVAALAAAEQRSSAGLEELRSSAQSMKQQADAAREQTNHAVLQVQQSQAELEAAQRELRELQRRPFEE